MPTPSVAGTPQAFNFTASGTVLTYTGGGSTTNSIDVLCVNSDTTVTVTGWTIAATRVNSQGAYIFTCNAGTASSATVTLSGGSFNTQVEWVRVTDTSGLDTGATTVAGVDGSGGSASPSLTSGALASATELALAFVALHSLSATPPATYVWSSGYVAQANGASVTGGTGSQVAGAVAVKVPAGTAAESPSVTWTNGTSDRYLLFVAFKESASGSTLNADSAPVTTATIASTAAVSRAANATTVAETATIASTAAVTRPADSAAATTATITATASVTAAGGMDSVRPITAGITATAMVVRNANAALVVGVSILAAPQPDAPVVQTGGGWNSLAGILDYNEQQARRELTDRPQVCPNHSYPLEEGPRGDVLHCTFGGEFFDLFGNPVYHPL